MVLKALYIAQTSNAVTLKEYQGGQLASTSSVNVAAALGLREAGDLDGSPERIKTLVTAPAATTSAQSLLTQLQSMGPDGVNDAGVQGCSGSGQGLFVGASGTRTNQYILVPFYQVDTQAQPPSINPLEIWVSDVPWSFLGPSANKLKYVATRTSTASVGFAKSAGYTPLGLPRFIDLLSYPVAVTLDGILLSDQYVRFGVDGTTITQVVYGSDAASVQTRYNTVRTSGDFDIPVSQGAAIPGVSVYSLASSSPITRTLTMVQAQPFGLTTDIVLAITLA